MRQPAFGEPRVSWSVVLLAVNAAAFLVQTLAAQWFLRGAQIEGQYLALSLDGLRDGYFWQLLTFQFMHVGWLHLIFNCLAIYFFGRPVETALGRGRFLVLYFSSGFIGGLVQMLFDLAFQNFDARVVGASAGAYGLVAAFAVLHWSEQITMLFYFIPVTLRGKTLLWITIALAAVGLANRGSNVADAAHLGGILTGFLYVRQIVGGRWLGSHFARRRILPRELAAAGKRKQQRKDSAATTEELISADDFIQSEVDPILEKISARGLQSLTASERQILETARRKMTRP